MGGILGCALPLFPGSDVGSRNVVVAKGITRHQDSKSSPPQRCGVHGIVPESSQFVVKKRYRNRAPGHFERGDVRTYQRPGNGKPALFQNAPRGIVHEIELEPWRAAEAIDEQQNAA